MRSHCWKIALLLSSLLLVGFEWEGRLNRLRRELGEADAARRREVVRLLASYPASAVKDALLEALGDPDAGVRTEAAEAVGHVRLREAVPRLLDWLDGPDAGVRASAALALGRIGAAQAVPPLVRLLGDSRAEVRKAAVTGLERIGTPDVVVPLLRRLDDADTSVRVAAAEALGRLGDPQAIVPLVGRLRDDAPKVRQAIYAALGQLGSSRAVPGLLQGLSDPALEVRLTAVGSLGRLKAEGAVPSLVELVDEPEDRVARAAVATLGAIGTPRAIETIVGALGRRETRETAASILLQIARRREAGPDEDTTGIVQALAQSLDQASEELHATAVARVLGRLGELTSIEKATPALLRALDANRGDAEALMRTLGTTGTEDALVPLLERLRSDDAARQQAALTGLERLFERIPPDGRAADPLLDALGEMPPPARPTVVRLLGEVGAQRAVPSLRELLDSQEARLRLAAVQALGAIGDPQGASALLPLLSDRDGRARFEAAQALAGAAGEPAVRTLLERLVDDTPRDRHAILMAIGGALSRLHRQGEVSAELARTTRAALEPILRGRDRRLAGRAIDAAARWGAPKNASLLEIVLQAGPPALRRQALRALGAVEGEHALAMLRRTLREADSVSVRAAAAAALGENGGAEDVPRLMEALDEGRWPVPASAAFAFARLVRRGRIAGDALDPEALCGIAARSRDAYVRANLALTLAALGGPTCPQGPDPARWLGSRHAPAVRAAATRWLAAQARHGHRSEDHTARVLERCAADDPSPHVARACGEPTMPALDAEADVYAYAADGSSLLTDRLVALRLADGSILVTYADLNGHVYLSDAPRGPLVLEDPVSTPLER